MSPSAHSKGLELTCEIEPQVPEAIMADPSRLRQILLNMLGNALKFTSQGEVAVAAKLDSSDGENLLLHFTVRDTGMGIPAEKLETIFAAFSQADSSTTRKFGGTGLGLAICWRLVELMHGKIWVESVVGQGSTFHFTAQVGVGDGSSAQARKFELKRLLGVAVLIVDDNSTNRRILADTVRRWGMNPRVEASAEAGLRALQEARAQDSPFALVLSDVQMAEMDGFTFVARIRKIPQLAGLAVILLTSGRQPEGTTRGKELGVAAQLLKPVARSELLAAIQGALGDSHQSNPKIRLITSSSSRQTSKGVRILLVEDNPVNQRVAVRMLEKNGYQVIVAGSGLEALATLDREKFDLILMDIQMPEMGGLEATAAIRKKEESTGGHIAIIAMTASAMLGDQERCLEAGMDDYISKPVGIRELIEKVEAHSPVHVEAK